MPQWRKLHVKATESLDVNDMPDDFHRLLWLLLPLGLDREGRGLDNTAWIKAKLMPLRMDVSLDNVEAAMAWYTNRGMVFRYQVENRSYFLVPTFARYQGDTKREAESQYPAPTDSVTTYSRPTSELVATKSCSDADSDADADSESDADSDADADARAPARAREGSGNDSSNNPSAELFRLIQDAGILVTQASAEQYVAVLDDDAQGDINLLRACFAEAAATGARPNPKWLRAVVWRCRQQSCMPGEWREKTGGNGDRASPVSAKTRAVMSETQAAIQRYAEAIEDGEQTVHQTDVRPAGRAVADAPG